MTTPSNRYGLIFDADVQIQDVTLADAEGMYTKVAEDLTAQTEPLAQAAQTSGVIAGTRMGAALRSALATEMGKGGIGAKLSSSLEDSLKVAVERLDMENIGINAKLESEELKAELSSVIEEVGTQSGAILGTKLAKSMSSSLNRSIGQIASNLQKKPLELKGKLNLDRGELNALQEHGVDLPVNLHLADAITKQVTDDVEVNLKVKNYSTIQKKLGEIFADVKLTEGAQAALEQLQSIPKSHTIQLHIQGAHDFDRIVSQFGKLTTLTIDASDINYKMVEDKAKDAGTRAANNAANAFRRTWKKLMSAMDFKLDVGARISHVEAPASTPTIGVKAQTQQVAHEAAKQTVQTAQREAAKKPVASPVPTEEQPARKPSTVQEAPKIVSQNSPAKPTRHATTIEGQRMVADMTIKGGSDDPAPRRNRADYVPFSSLPPSVNNRIIPGVLGLWGPRRNQFYTPVQQITMRSARTALDESARERREMEHGREQATQLSAEMRRKQAEQRAAEEREVQYQERARRFDQLFRLTGGRPMNSTVTVPMPEAGPIPSVISSLSAEEQQLAQRILRRDVLRAQKWVPAEAAPVNANATLSETLDPDLRRERHVPSAPKVRKSWDGSLEAELQALEQADLPTLAAQFPQLMRELNGPAPRITASRESTPELAEPTKPFRITRAPKFGGRAVQFAAKRRSDPDFLRTTDESMLARHLKHLAKSTEYEAVDDKGFTRQMMDPAILQLSSEVIESYSRNRATGMSERSIKHVKVSEEAMEQIKLLAASKDIKLTLPKDGRLPLSVANLLVGPHQNGSPHGALERIYLGGGTGRRFVPRNQNTLKNVAERQMLSGAVLNPEDLRGLKTPDDFVEMYARKFQTSNYVTNEEGQEMPAFAGPVYDWRFTQMAVATGDLTEADLNAYEKAMAQAKKISEPEKRAHAEAAAAKQLENRYAEFLESRLGFRESTAKHYASFIDPARIQRSIETFTTVQNGKRVLLSPEERMQRLLSSAIYGRITHADSEVYAGRMPDPAHYEDRGMHEALTQNLGQRASFSEGWQLMAKVNSGMRDRKGNLVEPVLVSDQGRVVQGVVKEHLSHVKDQVWGLTEAENQLRIMGLALTDMSGYDPNHETLMGYATASVLSDLDGYQDLPFDQAQQKVIEAAKRMAELRTKVRGNLKQNPDWKGRAKDMNSLGIVQNRKTSPLDALLGMAPLEHETQAALVRTGRKEMSIRELAAMDIDQAVKQEGLKHHLLQYANAVREGASDEEIQAMLAQRIYSFPQAQRVEVSPGKVEYQDAYMTLGDYINTQMDMYEAASYTFLRENELTASGVKPRIKGFLYDTRNSVRSTDLTVAEIAAQNPVLAGRVQAALPRPEDNRSLTHQYVEELKSKGLGVEGIDRHALGLAADYEADMRELLERDPEAFRVQQLTTLSARMPDVAHLIETDELGRPVLAGKDYKGVTVPAPVGIPGARFKLKEGAEAELERIVGAEAKRKLALGHGTLTGAMDANIREMFENMGYEYDTADGNSSAYKYNGLPNSDGSPNAHFVTEAPEHLQELLKARDFIMRDPVEAAKHYMGNAIAELDKSIAPLQSLLDEGKISKKGRQELDRLKRRRAVTHTQLQKYKHGQEVNPYDVLSYVKLHLPGVNSAYGMSARTFLAQSTTPVIQGFLDQRGDDVLDDTQLVSQDAADLLTDKGKQVRLAQRFSEPLQVIAPDGIPITRNMSLRGPLQSHVMAMGLLADKRFESSGIYLDMAKKVQAHNIQLGAKGLSKPEQQKMMELQDVLYQLADADATGLGQSQITELKTRYGQLATEFTPLLGSEFARQASMYGLGYRDQKYGESELGDTAISRLLSGTAKATDNAPTMLRALHQLGAASEHVSARRKKLSDEGLKDSAEDIALKELHGRVNLRREELTSRLSAMGIEPALTPAKERRFSEADVEAVQESRRQGRAWWIQNEERKAQAQAATTQQTRQKQALAVLEAAMGDLPPSGRVQIPRKLIGNGEAGKVRVRVKSEVGNSPVNLTGVVTDEVRAVREAKRISRSERVTAEAAETVTENVGTTQARKRIQLNAKRTVVNTRATAGDTVTVTAGQTSINVDFKPFEAGMKSLLSSLADIAQATQRKLQQVLDGVAGLTVDYSKFRPRNPGESYDHEEEDAYRRRRRAETDEDRAERKNDRAENLSRREAQDKQREEDRAERQTRQQVQDADRAQRLADRQQRMDERDAETARRAARYGNDSEGRELEGEDLFRDTAPYQYDRNLNQKKLKELAGKLGRGELSVDEFTAELDKEAMRARIDYWGGDAQAGAAAQVVGDRLKEEERERAVRMLGAKRVSQRDFFRFNLDPLKYAAQQEFAGLAEQHGVETDSLVQALMPHIRSSADYDPTHIRQLADSPEFMTLVRDGKVRQASQYLRNLNNGGEQRRDVLQSMFRTTQLPGGFVPKPEQFTEAYTLFSADFLETALNPNADRDLQEKAQAILGSFLAGGSDRNTAKKNAQQMMRDFFNPKSAGTKFSEATGEASNLGRASLFQRVFGNSAIRSSGQYANMPLEDATELWIDQDPQLADTVAGQLHRLRAYQNTLGQKSIQDLSGMLDDLHQTRERVVAGTAEDDELQAKAVAFENRVTSLRNGEQLRGKFQEYLRDPNSALVSNSQERLAIKQMVQRSTPAQRQAILDGDTDAMINLADQHRHWQERVKMYQNGVVNMAAFAASTLIQQAATAIITTLSQQETALSAVRAAANLQGTNISRSTTQQAGAKIAGALGVTRAEAMTLLAQNMSGDDLGNGKADVSGVINDMQRLKGLLSATGETTTELATFYGGLGSINVQDRAGVIQDVVSRGMSLKQAEENRKLVQEGLAQYGSDRDKALVIVGAQQVSGLKDWKLSDSTLIRERQMQRLEQYGAQQAQRSSTSLSLSPLQVLTTNAEAMLSEVAKLLEPLIALLGTLAVVLMKVVTGVAHVLNALPFGMGKLIVTVGALVTSFKMLQGVMELQTVQNMKASAMQVFGKVAEVPGMAKDMWKTVAGSAVGTAIGTFAKNTWSAVGPTIKIAAGTVGKGVMTAGVAGGMVGGALLNNAKTFIPQFMSRIFGMFSIGGNAAGGAGILSRLLPMIGRVGALSAGLLTGPAGWALTAGTLAYSGYKALKGQPQQESEQVTSMSVSGTDQTSQLAELAAAYSGDLTPAMEAAGYSVEEVRKRINEMAENGKGKTKELAQEVQKLARDYQLAGEFAKSLTTGYQTNIPLMQEKYRTQGFIPMVAKKDELSYLSRSLGVDIDPIDKKVYRAQQESLNADLHAADDNFFMNVRGFFVGHEKRNWLGHLLNAPSAREAYKNNPDLIAQHNALSEYQKYKAQEDAIKEQYKTLPDPGNEKAPSWWRMKYNEWTEIGENSTGFKKWWYGGNARSMKRWFGFGRGEHNDGVLTQGENGSGVDDGTYDAYTTLRGIRDGRELTHKAILKQFEKEGIKNLNDDSLLELSKKNPKAFLEVSKAVDDANRQEKEALDNLYRGNVQRAMFKATAPGVISDNVLNKTTGQGQMTSTFFQALNDPSGFASKMAQSQSGIQLRQAEAQRNAQLENLKRMGQELYSMQGTGMISKVQTDAEGAITGFVVDTKKMTEASAHTRERLQQLQQRVAETGNELGQLTRQIRDLNIEQIIQGAIGTVNLGNVQNGTVDLGGILSGNQSPLAGGGAVQNWIRTQLDATEAIGATVATPAGTSTGNIASIATAMNSFQKGVRVTQLPGERPGPLYGPSGHGGIDLAMAQGSSVKAFQGGRVIFNGIDQRSGMAGFGHRILVQNENGYVYAYSHMSGSKVKVGDTVAPGQVIGLSGGEKGTYGAGTSTGAHLDFTLYRAHPNGALPSQVVRDAPGYSAAGINGTMTPQQSKLNTNLTALLSNTKYTQQAALLENMKNRVAAAQKLLDKGNRRAYNAALNQIMKEGMTASKSITAMVNQAYKSAGAKAPLDMNEHSLLKGVLAYSGLDGAFQELVDRGGADIATRNAWKAVQKANISAEMRQSGDGTLYGNARAVRTADFMDSVTGANNEFSNTLMQLSSDRQYLRSGVPITAASYHTRRTADGFEYRVLKREFVAPDKWKSYQTAVSTALTRRQTAVKGANFQANASEEQTRMQGKEQEISLNLARNPRTPLEKVQYQIKAWNSFLGTVKDPNVKQAVRQKLTDLSQQLAEAERSDRAQQADQSVANANASNNADAAQQESVLLKYENQGDGTWQGTENQRYATYQRAVNSADLTYATTMNSLAQQFRKDNTNVPQDAYTTMKVNGKTYMVLKDSFVAKYKGTELGSRMVEAQQVWKNAKTAAKNQYDISKESVKVQQFQQQLSRELSRTPMRQEDKVPYLIRRWKDFLKANPNLHQDAKFEVNQRLFELENQKIDSEHEVGNQRADQMVSDASASNSALSASQDANAAALARQGNGTLADTRYQRQAVYQRSMNSAETQYADTMNSLAQQFRDKYKVNPEQAFTVKKTAGGKQYYVLKSEYVDRYKGTELVQRMDAAGTTLAAAQQEAAYQRDISGEQVKVQEFEQALSRELAQKPMRDDQRVQYQIDRWNQFLKANPGLHQDAKLDVNTRIMNLQNQGTEANRAFEYQKAEQSIATINSGNSLLVAQKEAGFFDAENSGDGTLADNALKRRTAQRDRSKTQAEDQYARTMNSLTSSFLTRYSDTPQDAFETRTTKSGLKYTVLKSNYVEQYKNDDLVNQMGAAEATLNTANKATDLAFQKDESQTAMQLAERKFNRDAAMQELNPFVKTQKALAFWQNFKKAMWDKLDQDTQQQLLTTIEGLQNQVNEGAPEFQRQVKEAGLNARSVTSKLSRMLGGNLDGTDYQIQSFQADRQILEIQKLRGKDDPLVQAAWKQANQFRRLAPTFDTMNTTVEEGKLNAIGQVGFEAFTTQNEALDNAIQQAKSGPNPLNDIQIKRVLGEQIAQRDEQLRQYAQMGRQAEARLRSEQGTLDIMNRQLSITKGLTNGALADQLIARVQRDNEKLQSSTAYDQAELSIVQERDNKTYSLDGIKTMAKQLGIEFDPNVGMEGYDDLNNRVAQARKSQAAKTRDAQSAQADKNFKEASAQRLASLLDAPLSRYETMGERIQALEATSSDVPEYLKAPLEAQLSTLKAGAESYQGFDKTLTEVRDKISLGETVTDADAQKLFTGLRSMPINLQNMVSPALQGLMDKTESAGKFRTMKAQDNGLTIEGQQKLNEQELKTLAVRFGGVTGEALQKRALEDLEKGVNIPEAQRVLELFKEAPKLQAQLDEMQKVAQPIETRSREIQDAERTQGREAGLQARRDAVSNLNAEFDKLSQGKNVSDVLKMSQEDLNKQYGNQAPAVKRLADFLRQLGIEIDQTTDAIEAENRARDVQQAQLAANRVAEYGDSADINQANSTAVGEMQGTLSGMLKDPQTLEQALELSRKNDRSGLGKLLTNENQVGEFMQYGQNLDAFRAQGAQAYLTAAVREATQADSAQLVERYKGSGGNLSTLLADIEALRVKGEQASLQAFDKVFTTQGGQISEKGEYTYLGKTFASRDELRGSGYQFGNGAISSAVQYVNEGAGGMTGASAAIAGMLPEVQAQVEMYASQGNFTQAQGSINAAYSALVLLINKLLEQAGTTFRFNPDVADARTDQVRGQVAQVGMNAAGKGVMQGALPMLSTVGVESRDIARSMTGEAQIASIERKYAANQPIYRSERAMLQFEHERLAETNQMLEDQGLVKFKADGSLNRDGSDSKMVQVYEQNMKRIVAITEEKGILLYRQWRDMLTQMVDDTKGAITDGLTLLVSELLTGQHYRKKVEEIDKNMDNRVTNAENSLEKYQENKDLAAQRMKTAANKYGTGSQQYLDAKAEYDFYNQRILEMKDNVAALNTEWQQQKFELKTIGEMLSDIFNNLANQIINKTISRTVDWGLDAIFGAASAGSGNGGGGGANLITGLLSAGGKVLTGQAMNAGTSSLGAGVTAGATPALAGQSMFPTTGVMMTAQSAGTGAAAGVFGIKGLTQGAIGGALTSFGVTEQSGNPLIGMGVGALQMGLAGGMAGMAAAGGSLAAFGPAAIAALTNPVGWAALAVGSVVGMVVKVNKEHKERDRREHVDQNIQGVNMYGLKPGQNAHKPPTVIANVQVQSLTDFGTTRALTQRVVAASKLQSTKLGLTGVPS